MSIYKIKKSPYWYINITIRGYQIRCSTKQTDEKEAQKMHDNIRDKLWEAVYLGNLSEKIKNL
jgi:hypothetical protein